MKTTKSNNGGSMQRVVRPFVYLHIYDQTTGHCLKGHWRSNRTRPLADMVLRWIEEAHAITNEIEDYQI